MYLTGVKRRKKSEGGGVGAWMIWDGISRGLNIIGFVPERGGISAC